ncbi:DJ-1/PfpI family protein, partial [Ideonella sp.]|uniref:DJ-1/PfpI family protein n=1 Tax=Ideonella sp. TaxID=1929293 RepID=UPI003BB6A026
MSDSSGSQVVAVLLYPGCIFFEIALAAEQLASRFELRYYTPDGAPHAASNGATLLPAGDYRDLAQTKVAAVLVPGGDPRSIIPAALATAALQAAGARGSLMAGICAGNLVLASVGLLKGRRGTHNYTPEHAPAHKVA